MIGLDDEKNDRAGRLGNPDACASHACIDQSAHIDSGQDMHK